MRRTFVPFYSVLLAGICSAQLTLDQKLLDFQTLAAVYAKNYAPYEWKLQTQGFDLLDIRPWLDQVRQTKTDLEFYDVMFQYVARLNDAHVVFELPSDFGAVLGFGVGLYDGKALIEGINRTLLPTNVYSFATGDEIVSLDGISSEELIQKFTPYNISANTRSTRAFAATMITSRHQMLYPRAHEIGDSATVVIRRSDGNLATYTIPWVKTGTPLLQEGPVPSPRGNRRAARAERNPGDPSSEAYMEPLSALQWLGLPASRNMSDSEALVGFGSRGPYYALPAGFVTRAGTKPTDFFFSGTFQAGGLNLGLIRFPNFDPFDPGTAVQQFEAEIRFMQANTDGLIIDDTRNPGGGVCYTQALLARLIPTRFRTTGSEIRATAHQIAGFSSALTAARSGGAPQWVIDLYTALLDAVKTAYAENRGLTGPLAVCAPNTLDIDPATDSNGNVIAYNKPLLVLVDELSTSAAEIFAAVIQDNGRGPLFGMRTMGAGGSFNRDFDSTIYSEGVSTVTQSLTTRRMPIVTTDFPTAPYIENIGVRPEIPYDYMTKENLVNSGRAFVQAFTQAMVDHVRAARDSNGSCDSCRHTAAR